MMRGILVAATLFAVLFAAPVVAPSGYAVTSVLHLVGTACDGGGGGW